MGALAAPFVLARAAFWTVGAVVALAVRYPKAAIVVIAAWWLATKGQGW